MGWGDQIAKWFNAWIWWLTPLPEVILTNDLFFYFWDWIQFDFNKNTKGIRPTMYNNWFTKLFMTKNMWGPFKWYDVFTLQGFLVWLIDGLSLTFIPWWELIEAIIRSDKKDWSWNIINWTNFVDKNRIFRWKKTPLLDPYDYSYWSTRQKGVDCYGN